MSQTGQRDLWLRGRVAGDTILCDRKFSSETTPDQIYHDAIAEEYERYERIPRVAVAEQHLREEFYRAIKPGAVLEIGAGTGTLAKAFSDLGDPYIALDASRGMLEVAHKIELGRSVVLLHADACDLPLKPDLIDTVICWGALHHIPKWPLAIAEIVRVLTPGGRLIVREPNARYAERAFIPAEKLISVLHKALRSVRLSRGGETASMDDVRGVELLGDTSPSEEPFSLSDFMLVARSHGLELERSGSPMLLASLGVPDDLAGGLRPYFEWAHVLDKLIHHTIPHQRGALWTAHLTKTSVTTR